MGILNMFKAEDTSRDIPPPPPLEELPEFPEPSEDKKAEMAMPAKAMKPAKKKTFVENMETKAPTRPLFIKLDDYQHLLSELSALKTNLDRSVDVTANLEEIRKREEDLYKRWQKQLKDVQTKLMFADHTLFEMR